MFDFPEPYPEPVLGPEGQFVAGKVHYDFTEMPLSLNPDEAATVFYFERQPDVSSVRVWRDPDGFLGLTFVEDELAQTGYFDGDGYLTGDWHC